MAGLKALNPFVTFQGVGGPLMQAEGLQSLFPMEELSVMGIAEDTLTVEFPTGFKTIKAGYVQPASGGSMDDVPF